LPAADAGPKTIEVVSWRRTWRASPWLWRFWRPWPSVLARESSGT